jgi:hypothetical protein
VADTAALLERHRPRLRYDSHEVYFADSAAEWTDSAGQTLRRGAQGAVLAETPDSPPTPLLSLAFLGPERYADATAVDGEDLISCPYRDYAERARTLHAQPRYANRAYGRAAVGSDERAWLQYWFFYFYNDFELLGDEFPAGLHEGDWEMIQLRLDAAGQAPDLAVYAKHKRADARPWDQVELIDGLRPVVYVARGSHAAYFDRGTHWGEAWFDHADGDGPSPELTLEIADDADPAYAWLRWPGYWGDTKPHSDRTLHPFDDSSPRGPGGHAQWKDPHALLATVEDHERFEPHAPPGGAAPAPLPAPVEPPAPSVSLTRSGQELLRVSYSCPTWPAQLVPVRLLVTVDSPNDPLPPLARSITISSAEGTVDVPIQLSASWKYDVRVAIAGRLAGTPAGAPPLTSASTAAEPLPALTP